VLRDKRGFILLLLAALFSAQAYALNELREVKLTSCRPGVCTELDTAKVFRSNLQPNLMVFSAAHMSLVDASAGHKVLSEFEAGDGYYDLREQVIVLRNLKHSIHHELIYDLKEGKFIYF